MAKLLRGGAKSSPMMPGMRVELPKTVKSWPTLDGAIAAARAMVGPGAVVANVFEYHNADGSGFGAVARFNVPTEPGQKQAKTFRPFHTVLGGWALGDPLGKWPLYRLPTSLVAEQVNIFEGEHKADVSGSCGMAATATVHGAKSAGKTDYSPLANVSNVNIWLDNDKASEEWGADVTAQVRAVNPRCIIKIVRIADHVAGFPDHGDFADFAEEFRDGQSAESIRLEAEGWITQTEAVKVEAAALEGADADALPPLVPINFAELDAQRPERGPAVIDGILREGAVGTLIGGSKTHKSFCVAALIAAALSGGTWFGHSVRKCRVCLIDGELTRATIYFRLRKVFEALGIDAALGANLDIFDLRGRTRDGERAMHAVKAKGPGYYGLIILDPQYVFYPDDPGFSENDNAHMSRLYDAFICNAIAAQAAMMVVHHLSKGVQSDKGLTDLGAGAGAIARKSDAHLPMRLHVEKDVVVFDGVVRDFPELVPTCWRWQFPTFIDAPELDPTDLAGGRKRKSVVGEFLDGGKAKPTMPTPTEFAAKFLTDEGRELAYLQAKGGEDGLTDRAVERLIVKAVAIGQAHKWPGGPGTPTRYAKIPLPVTEVKNTRAKSRKKPVDKGESDA